MTFAPNGLLTLTTDFGMADGYVGAMKGAALSVAPALRLCDLAHGLPPQDVARAAATARAACPRFPAGTTHLVVVDPGVGTSRAAIVVLAGGHAFVGPDNGVLHPVAVALGGAVAARRIEAHRYVAPAPSATFHGRDVFAPTAAALASALLTFAAVGPPWAMRDLAAPRPRPEGEGLRGQIVTADRFGNLVSNISLEDLRALASPSRLRVVVGALDLPIVGTYGDVVAGAPLALVGSDGLLEIAVREGSALVSLALGPGSPVLVCVSGPSAGS